MFKWDQFSEILATGRSGMHCKIKESLLIRDLKPALENVGSEKLHLYSAYSCRFMSINFVSFQSAQLFFEFKFICNLIIITFDDVCCSIRNVKFIKVMQFKQVFVTAVCVLFPKTFVIILY